MTNGVDEAESSKNQQVITIPKIQDHASFFANMQIPEQRKFRLKANGSIVNQPNEVGIQSSSNLASNNPNVLPVLTQYAVSAIAATTATYNSEIQSYGSTAISNYGHCWATTSFPTISTPGVIVDSKGVVTAPLAFTTNATGLTGTTTYYIRAFATTATGTVYSNQITFNTL